MDKRVRSPNYPALSLPEAVERAKQVFANQHTHGAPREVVAKSMGYNTLNGASATAISALIKYGLLEGRADEIKISDRAMRILHSQSQAEKAEAILEAASAPELFRELGEKFPGRMPAEEVVRSYLIRRGFAETALSPVILAYRETNEFVDREAGAYDSGVEMSPETAAMQTSPQVPTTQTIHVGQKIHIDQGNSRTVFRYDFEGGDWLRFEVGGRISTEDALGMAETLIALKRKEIERNATKAAAEEPDKKES